MSRTSRLLALFSIAVTLAATGCNHGPTAPKESDPAPIQIQTPISAAITSISVTKFPATKPDGSDWDFSLLTASKRPDLYVILTVDGQPADYVSNYVTDAVTSKVYTFTQPRSIYDGSLPSVVPYGASHRIYVMDSDVGGDDDRVGWITVNLLNAYQDDNARNLDYTFTDSGKRLSVRVKGTWNY